MTPYPQFTSAGWGYEPGATWRYNSLQVREEERLTQSLSLLASFTHFKLSERLVLEFRAESFNALHTPVFGGPSGSVASSAFGVISTQFNAPRQNQMALKIRS